jgi:hypothetical protein
VKRARDINGGNMKKTRKMESRKAKEEKCEGEARVVWREGSVGFRKRRERGRRVVKRRERGKRGRMNIKKWEETKEKCKGEYKGDQYGVGVPAAWALKKAFFYFL